MGTWVLYIDEAGSPDPYEVPLKNGATPLFTLAGLALPLAGWRERDRKFLKLKKEFYSDAIVKEGSRPEYFEIKGHDLTKPSSVKSKRAPEFRRRVFKIISDEEGRAFAATFVKNPQKRTDAHSLYTSALQILVERFSVFIAETEDAENGILICDSRLKGLHSSGKKGSDINVAKSHLSYIFGHHTGRMFTNIIEAPLFSDSKITVGVQLIDIVASCVYSNHYRMLILLKKIDGALNYEHSISYWADIQKLTFDSQTTVDGYQLHSFRVVDFMKT